MLSKYNKLFSGAIFVAAAVALGVQIPAITVTNLAADSRLMPIIVVVLLLLFGLPLLAEGFAEFVRGRKAAVPQPEEGAEAGKPDPEKRAGLYRMLLCALFFALYTFLLTRLGFVVSSAIYLIANFLVLAPKEKRNLIFFAVLSVAVPAAIYVIFVKGFRVILPTGKFFM